MDKRIHIITGHYGSGKSEISVNMALALKEQHIVFADLDIINPYFRSNEARRMLEEKGITVMTTQYANTNIDIPALTGDLSRYLMDKNTTIVMDVGGDDAGTRVVGRYSNEIPAEQTALYFVLNCFRPETSTLEGAVASLEEIRAAGRMDVNYIINNSHLMEDTTQEDILQGKNFAEQVSRATGIPIAFHAILRTTPIYRDLQFREPVFHMEKTMGLASHLKNAGS